MFFEDWGIALKHLESVFTAGALGSLPDGRLLERFLSGRGDADSSLAFAALLGATRRWSWAFVATFWATTMMPKTPLRRPSWSWLKTVAQSVKSIHWRAGSLVLRCGLPRGQRLKRQEGT